MPFVLALNLIGLKTSLFGLMIGPVSNLLIGLTTTVTCSHHDLNPTIREVGSIYNYSLKYHNQYSRVLPIPLGI
jgi:hypothetical protein